MILHEFSIENTAGHNEWLEIKVESYEIHKTWFDQESYNDYYWVGLHFNWDLPLSHYINIGVLKVGC